MDGPQRNARKDHAVEVKGMTPDQLRTIVDLVSMVRYGGNIRVDWEGSTPRLLNRAGTRFRGRIMARSSHGPGARRSWSGRRLTAACWHVFRDVIRAALAEYPDAVFTTSLARYTAANFEATYPATGSRNIGSVMQPVTMPELCDHGDDAAWTGAPAPRTSRRRHSRDLWVQRIDAVQAMKPGTCGWCNRSTGTESMMWCSESCQDQWQLKYAVS